MIATNNEFGSRPRLNIAVIGSGISGLSAAWLLSQRHDVTLFESESRLGGHCNTVDVDDVAVDTGFIVYNEATYPNLTALFRHLGVATKISNMSFAVSLDDGRLEYCGTGLKGLFAQSRNAISPRFWGMLRDLVRFYQSAPKDMPHLGTCTLGEYLTASNYGKAFRDDHLYPMAAAIWSTPAAEIGNYPADAFIRFCANHGLLKLVGRPIWRTVVGGSRTYVRHLAGVIPDIVSGCPVKKVLRGAGRVEIIVKNGQKRRFDHAVIATHADQALAMLANPTSVERLLLGAFSYIDNEAVLHTDVRLMPRQRKVWSSWNYLSRDSDASRKVGVSYWMNRLQDFAHEVPLFVTLNPPCDLRAGTLLRHTSYRHPRMNTVSLAAQRRLWSLQGVGNTWFCGAYFGSGFHEDGLQAGLAVAEALGGQRRPWRVADESARICLQTHLQTAMEQA